MPRLSKSQYWKLHRTLRFLWLNHQYLYSYLLPERQWQLHDFFLPSKDITREELLAHRKLITKEQPGLPHQAGWALHELNRWVNALARLRQEQPAKVVAKGKATNTIGIRSIVKPEIDEAKLADAFLLLAKEMRTAQGDNPGDKHVPQA